MDTYMYTKMADVFTEEHGKKKKKKEKKKESLQETLGTPTNNTRIWKPERSGF